MKGTMPATVNSSDGSDEISDADGTGVWPLLEKNVIQRSAISWEFISLVAPYNGSLSKSAVHYRGLPAEEEA
jgi:hypothetical protein